MIPVKSRIHPDQLNDQPVEFHLLPRGEPEIQGLGVLLGFRASTGVDYIELLFHESGDVTHKRWLTQEWVDAIQPHPSGVGFVIGGRRSNPDPDQQ